MGKAGFLERRILDSKSEFKTGKLDPPDPLAQPPKCPECTSQKVWRDGLRYTRQGEVQRWLCRDCGHRFSETKVKLNVVDQTRALHPRSHLAKPPIRKGDFSLEKTLNDSAFPFSKDVGSHNVTVVGKRLNDLCSYNSKRQVCVSEREAKNLSQQSRTRQKQAAGATKSSKSDIKERLVEFAWALHKDGYRESTIKRYTKGLLTLQNKKANLSDPDSVKETIARQSWKENTKSAYVFYYDSFVKFLGIHWTRPKYEATRQFPFIPLEREIDQLIHGCGRKQSVTLQLIKETAMRIGEVHRLKWTDINIENNTIVINDPEKGSNPGIYKVSKALVSRIMSLPKKSEKIFPASRASVSANFIKARKRLARKFQNPRLLRITFHTIRHWKATMEYHRTKDIIHVKENILRHKSILNTMIYIHLEKAIFSSTDMNEYHVKVAGNVEEACELVKAGFQYVTGEYGDGGKIFRKRK